MRSIRDGVLHGVFGFGGIILGVLSAAALTIAAATAALLGMLAFLGSPPRTVFERIRRP